MKFICIYHFDISQKQISCPSSIQGLSISLLPLTLSLANEKEKKKKNKREFQRVLPRSVDSPRCPGKHAPTCHIALPQQPTDPQENKERKQRKKRNSLARRNVSPVQPEPASLPLAGWRQQSSSSAPPKNLLLCFCSLVPLRWEGKPHTQFQLLLLLFYNLI